MVHQLTPKQKSIIARQKERRRRERERREDEYRRRIDELRRRTAEARKRRQRLLLMLLLALFATIEAMRPKFLLFMCRTEPIPEPSPGTPDPNNDYAPASGCDDYCDGYTYDQWTQMLNERGINLSRKAEMKAEWEADPERKLFPVRYQLWGHRPYIGQILDELTAQYWRADAFAALKLLTPHEVHPYLDEAYTAGSTFRDCFANRDADIITAFQNHALLWEERKRREVEEARRTKNDLKPDDDKKKFEP
ncbi:MAG: hypothetical protein QE284_19930 [Rhizobium sp.]|nr:hypothetical protein [Rhizobium sp.]